MDFLVFLLRNIFICSFHSCIRFERLPDFAQQACKQLDKNGLYNFILQVHVHFFLWKQDFILKNLILYNKIGVWDTFNNKT